MNGTGKLDSPIMEQIQDLNGHASGTSISQDETSHPKLRRYKGPHGSGDRAKRFPGSKPTGQAYRFSGIARKEPPLGRTSGRISQLGSDKTEGIVIPFPVPILKNTSNLTGAVNSMDNDEILTKYIDKVDRDQVQLRDDIRESERRISGNIKDIEERTESQIVRIETRMDERLNRIEDNIAKTNENIEVKFEDTRKTMYAVLDNVKSSNKQNFWFFITTLLAIIGIAVTTVFALLSRSTQ